MIRSFHGPSQRDGTLPVGHRDRSQRVVAMSYERSGEWLVDSALTYWGNLTLTSSEFCLIRRALYKGLWGRTTKHSKKKVGKKVK